MQATITGTKHLTCTVIGSHRAGKTTLLVSYTRESLETFGTTVFDIYSAHLDMGDKSVRLDLRDTNGINGGPDDASRLRPLSYPGTDVFLVCFDVFDQKHFEAVRDIWVPEITRHCPNVPFLLCGTQTDKKGQEKTRVSSEDAEYVAQELGAWKYVQCSSVSREGLSAAFECVAECALSGAQRVVP